MNLVASSGQKLEQEVFLVALFFFVGFFFLFFNVFFCFCLFFLPRQWSYCSKNGVTDLSYL